MAATVTNVTSVAPASVARLPFRIAAALVAAALADPVVESIANTGVLGGHDADTNRLSVVPTLLVASTLVAALIAVRSVAAWRRSARDARVRPLDAPAVFGLQLAALFVMESSEQFAVSGHVHGGLEWLGGPIAFSLGVHALVALGATFALAWLTRTVAATVVTLARGAGAFIVVHRARSALQVALRRCDAPACLRAGLLRVRDLGGRAPPLLAPRR